MEKTHKDRLQTNYLKLLQNITDYKNIIAGLHSKKTLTAAMKEKVEQKRGSDQLREILDILPRRGPTAFKAFYEVLVECGEDYAADLLCPELAAHRHSRTAIHIKGIPVQEEDELPEKWPDFSHDGMRVNVVTVSAENTGMREVFSRAVEGRGSAYAMHKPDRGIFLLISNEFFKAARANGEDLSDRDGTGKDVTALDNLFRQLHFRVVIKLNLTAKEMMEAFRTQVSEVHITDNCFACAVLTHGESGSVYGVDGKKVDLEDLKATVTDHCQLLIGKPKLFFIQACQGKNRDSGEMTRGQGDAGYRPVKKSENEDFQDLAEKLSGSVHLRDDNQSDAASEGRVSPKSDIFVAMATIPDFVSWRNTNWGTWFVQAVACIFARSAHKSDINQLMTRVNKLVSKAETSKGYKQVSVYSSSLTSDFFFFPGLQRGMPESHSEVDFQRSCTYSRPESGSITAQPTDDIDGEKSVLVP